ncbi:MAG TPA: HtaA domain-containing protein, partial [Solirubrobacterales bacterium]|nr:HtaA domain-containing protein [Solirubrobacterales bacterium]
MIRTTFNRAVGATTAVALAAAVVLTALVAPAAAAPGQAALEISGPAAQALRAEGVKISPLGAAKGGAKRIVLPVRTGLVGATATVLRFGGGVALRKGKQRLRLGDLRLTLGRRNGLAGKLGGEAAGLFRVLKGGQREIDPARGSARLSGLRLQLSRSAARELAARLGLERRPAGVFATLSAADEDLPQAAPDSPSKAEEKSTACPLPSTAGPAPEEPLPVASRPPAAVDVTGASLSWNVRDSFIRYINTGEGTSVFGGAVAGAQEVRPGSALPLTYRFGFPFASGWVDTGSNPTDPADDRAAVYFSGGVRFLYTAHGIDLRTSAPEIELGGGASRAI